MRTERQREVAAGSGGKPLGPAASVNSHIFPHAPCFPSPRSAMQQHTASDVFNEQQLFFQVLVLERQLYCWIGAAPGRLSTLCLATPTRLVRGRRRRRRRWCQSSLAGSHHTPHCNAGPRTRCHLAAARAGGG